MPSGLESELYRSGSIIATWKWPDLHSDEVIWSPTFFRLLGYEPGAVTPTKHLFWNLLHPEDHQRVFEQSCRIIHDAANLSLEYRLLRTDGEHRWFEATAVVQRGQSDEPLATIGTLRDIHDRRQLLDQLRRLEVRPTLIRAALALQLETWTPARDCAGALACGYSGNPADVVSRLNSGDRDKAEGAILAALSGSLAGEAVPVAK